jgi:hypothetical protein
MCFFLKFDSSFLKGWNYGKESMLGVFASGGFGSLITTGLRYVATGVSPRSGCETGHPTHPFALHSATAFRPRVRLA